MRRFLVVLALLVAISGCGAEKQLVRFVNTPPVATLTADPDTLAIEDTSTVTCEVYDPDGDLLSYRWTASAGRFIRRDPGYSQVSWIAPDVEGADTVWVTVFDHTDSVHAHVALRVVGHTGTLTGVVKDGSTGGGVPGAMLAIGGRSTTTDANGHFRLELLPPGGDTLRVVREGYDLYEEYFLVREGANSVEVMLTPAAARAPLAGTVTNRLGQPVAGAVCGVGEDEVSTNPAGEYAFAGVLLGPQLLTVRASGYYTASDTVDVQPPGVHRDVVLQAAPPAQPAGELTVTKLEGDRLRVQWLPEVPPSATTGFNLSMIVSGDSQGLPQPVPGGPLPRTGGVREVAGSEDYRYSFAVAAVNIDEVVGVATPYTPVVVLTPPSPLVTVPAGPVIMGSYPDEYGNELHPGNPVQVEAFSIETHEVTNRQFVAYLIEASAQGRLVVSETEVSAEGQVILSFAGSQVDRDPAHDGFSVPSDLKDYPVTGLSWFGADAYARWHGRRLPSEAEWEKAARGTADSTVTYEQTAVHVGTRYPWGDAPPDERLANYNRHFNGKRPVGSLPDGAARWWGTPVLDLAGNVWEWCEDWFAPYPNPHQPPSTGSRRVVRGGGWDSPAGEVRVGQRWFLEPALTSTKIGFRCAADPAKATPE